jgi:hypothetical protein
MKYYVFNNLRHDGEDHLKGSQVEFDEGSTAAQRLLASGVISTTPPQEQVLDAPAPAEEASQPNVGGQAIQSGEPSVDGQPEAAVPSDATDVTPEVSEKMSRAELEEAARAKGIPDEQIDAAENKAALVGLMTAPQEATAEENDPSANL